MSDSTPQELANALLEKGTFKFADALKGRTYPIEDVDIYLDEAAAYPLTQIDGRANALDHKISNIKPEKIDEEFAKALLAQRDVVEEERVAITEALKSKRYVVTLTGIEPGKQDEFRAQAYEEYPAQYTEYYTNPLTGARSREEIPSRERDRLFTNLIWQAHVLRITDPSGAVDERPDLDTVAGMRYALPVASRVHLEQGIEKVDNAVDWYEALADEVFLVKS